MDTVDALRKRTHRLHEENTEPPEIAANNAKKIIEFLIKKKGVKDGRLEFNVLCVLGAGWDEVWKEAFDNVSIPGVEITPNFTVFDYNKSQIEEFGKGKDVVEMMIGDAADNNMLEEFLEDGIDIFIPSNIPSEWLERKEVINLAELVRDNPPLVICFAGKREYGGFGDFVDELDNTYRFDRFESSDMSYEVRHQVIGYLMGDEIEPEVES